MDFEPTQENMDLHFNFSSKRHLRGMNFQADECFGCALKGNRGVMLQQETDPKRKAIVTIMGEEDIDVEIEKMKERKVKGEFSAKDVDVSTPEKENTHRTKRREDIRLAILRAKELEDTN